MNEDFLQPTLGNTETENAPESFTYVCPTCHTSFVSSDAILTTCIFCGGAVSKGDTKQFHDYSYVPFQLSLEDAYNIYKKETRHNALLPFSFRGKKIMKKIQKAYIPCNLYNMSVEGNITFFGADKIKGVKNAPKQVFECLYSTHFDYFNLLISDYSRIKDVSVSNVNDYDFINLSPVDSVITGDSCLIVSDVEKNEVTEKVQDRVLKHCVNIVRGNVGHELKKLSDNHLVLGISSAQSVFVPVYFINFRYQGQEYLFLVNGQTGKTIIDVPSSKGNLILLAIGCFLLISSIACLVAYFI